MSDVDTLNDRVQQSTSRRECALVLATCTQAEVRAIADLNHIDPDGAVKTVVGRIIDDRHGAYRPGHAFVGAVSPQTNPELFSDEDLRKEIKYLLGLNKRYGSHELRTVGYTKLLHILAARS